MQLPCQKLAWPEKRFRRKLQCFAAASDFLDEILYTLHGLF